MPGGFPYGLVLGLGLPIVLLVIFGSIPTIRQANTAWGGLSYFSVSFPVLIGLSIFALSLLVLPRSLVTYREKGILRHLSTTPVPPTWLLAAQVVVNLVTAVAGLLILTVVGIAAFGLEVPKDLLGFLIASSVTITALFAMGLCTAAIAINNAVATVIGVLLAYVLFLLLSVFLLLSSYWNWWGAIFGWLGHQSAAGLACWLVPPIAIFALAFYALLRRAAV